MCVIYKKGKKMICKISVTLNKLEVGILEEGFGEWEGTGSAWMS